MSGPSLALGIAFVAVAIAGFFVVYAVSGADLCMWCGALGR
jgi:hypothetical protein